MSEPTRRLFRRLENSDVCSPRSPIDCERRDLAAAARPRLLDEPAAAGDAVTVDGEDVGGLNLARFFFGEWNRSTRGLKEFWASPPLQVPSLPPRPDKPGPPKLEPLSLDLMLLPLREHPRERVLWLSESGLRARRVVELSESESPGFLRCDKPIKRELAMRIEEVDVACDTGRERIGDSRTLDLLRDETKPPPATEVLFEGATALSLVCDEDVSMRFDALDSFSKDSKKRAPDKCESARLGIKRSE